MLKARLEHGVTEAGSTLMDLLDVGPIVAARIRPWLFRLTQRLALRPVSPGMMAEWTRRG